MTIQLAVACWQHRAKQEGGEEKTSRRREKRRDKERRGAAKTNVAGESTDKRKRPPTLVRSKINTGLHLRGSSSERGKVGGRKKERKREKRIKKSVPADG